MISTSEPSNWVCEWKFQNIPCCNTPSATDAHAAQTTLVMRAKTTAARTNVSEVMSRPTLGALWARATDSTPANPLIAPATCHGALDSRVTSTPRVAARSISDAVARLRSPRRPRSKRSQIKASMTRAAPTVSTS